MKIDLKDKMLGIKQDKSENERLELSVDYYALSFCAMMSHYRKQCNITYE